jgi:hypothetical protein
MGAVVAISLFAAAAVILWTAKIVVFEAKERSFRSLSFIVAVVAVAIAAYWFTFNYDYFPNPNTHVYGWPVPSIIFQRDSATAPWLDFVGPTVVLGLPMNFTIFMLIPSLAFLTQATWRRWRFSTRTLLITVTLVAAALGLAVWAMNSD